MAAVEMTFSLPASLVQRFVRRVPAQERSRFVAAALEETLKKQQAELIRACQLANEDPEVAAIEREMDSLQDHIEEPWEEPSPR